MCHPDLIKMDVEGFEFEVTRGGESVLQNLHPALLIEIHPAPTQAFRKLRSGAL